MKEKVYNPVDSLKELPETGNSQRPIKPQPLPKKKSLNDIIKTLNKKIK
ncbi:MAG: hypothetical protein RSH25_12955 [Bacteroides sp.]